MALLTWLCSLSSRLQKSSLLISAGGAADCGGSLISDREAMTFAHSHVSLLTAPWTVSALQKPCSLNLASRSIGRLTVRILSWAKFSLRLLFRMWVRDKPSGWVALAHWAAILYFSIWIISMNFEADTLFFLWHHLCGLLGWFHTPMHLHIALYSLEVNFCTCWLFWCFICALSLSFSLWVMQINLTGLDLTWMAQCQYWELLPGAPLHHTSRSILFLPPGLA